MTPPPLRPARPLAGQVLRIVQAGLLLIPLLAIATSIGFSLPARAAASDFELGDLAMVQSTPIAFLVGYLAAGPIVRRAVILPTLVTAATLGIATGAAAAGQQFSTDHVVALFLLSAGLAGATGVHAGVLQRTFRQIRADRGPDLATDVVTNVAGFFAAFAAWFADQHDGTTFQHSLYISLVALALQWAARGRRVQVQGAFALGLLSAWRWIMVDLGGAPDLVDPLLLLAGLGASALFKASFAKGDPGVGLLVAIAPGVALLQLAHALHGADGTLPGTFTHRVIVVVSGMVLSELIDRTVRVRNALDVAELGYPALAFLLTATIWTSGVSWGLLPAVAVTLTVAGILHAATVARLRPASRP